MLARKRRLKASYNPLKFYWKTCLSPHLWQLLGKMCRFFKTFRQLYKVKWFYEYNIGWYIFFKKIHLPLENLVYWKLTFESINHKAVTVYCLREGSVLMASFTRLQSGQHRFQQQWKHDDLMSFSAGYIKPMMRPCVCCSGWLSLRFILPLLLLLSNLE